jgi:hypothetical protein
MRRWLAYAATSVAVLLVGCVVGLLLAPPGAAGALWLAAGVALAVQLLAFALLVAFGQEQRGFLLGWLGGIALRFLAVLVVALAVSRADSFHLATTLLSLVAFVFLLLLLEPIFLRRALPSR